MSTWKQIAVFWGDFSGRGGSGCGAAVTAFVPFPLALFSSTDTLLCLAVPPEGSKILSALEGGRVMRR